jgi:hypothetical protein
MSNFHQTEEEYVAAEKQRTPAPVEGEAVPVAWVKLELIEKLRRTQANGGQGAFNTNIASVPITETGHTEPLYPASTIATLQARIAKLEEDLKGARYLQEYSDDTIARLERKWKYEIDRAEYAQRLNAELLEALKEILAMVTPWANATVRRMAAAARAAISKQEER